MKIQSPWMGRVRGSAGNMTGSKVYDKNVMRAKAFEVSNPNTAAQQTERSFFAQVADCCASVSEEQLRSLFGVKPKSMSRRNALTRQVLTMLADNKNDIPNWDGQNFSIGSGEKVTTGVTQYQETDVDKNLPITRQNLNIGENQTPNMIVVFFDTERNSISIINTNVEFREGIGYSDVLSGLLPQTTGWVYITCAADGSNVYLRGFGSFIIKTRGEK